MITGIDHIVIAVPNLQRALSTYRGLGFTAVAGGRHAQCTHNALIAFADGSYVELLAFYEACAEHLWWERAQAGALADFCLGTDDIEADYAALGAAGVPMSPLTRMSRLRPDGYELSWTNNKVQGALQGLIPFLITDHTPREERLPPDTEHANGASGISCVAFATMDLERSAGVMAALTGGGSERIEDEELMARGLRVKIGRHALDYLTPVTDEGPLAAHLAATGPGPFQARFQASGPPQSIDPRQAEGARISFTP